MKIQGWIRTAGILLLGVAAVIFAVLWGGGHLSLLIDKHYAIEHQVNAAYQENAERDRKKASDEIAQSCKGTNFLVFRQCIRSKLESYYRDQSTNQDLKSQKDMALWAYYLLWATGISIVLSLAGLGLLLWSLMQTRSALRAGRSAADAAHDANVLLKLEQRPWVTITVDVSSKISFEEAKVHIPICITLKNIGKNPAVDVRSAFIKRDRFIQDGAEGSTFETLLKYKAGRTDAHGEDNESRRVIVPGGVSFIEDLVTFKIKKGEILPVIFVSVTYTIPGIKGIRETHSAFLLYGRDSDGIPEPHIVNGEPLEKEKAVFKALPHNSMT